MPKEIEPRVILITGAAHGIGRACAQQLISEGHTVYGGDIDFDAMADLETEGMKRLSMDVTSDEQVTAGVATVIAEQGRIDGLLANAGYTCMGMIETVDLDDAKRNFEVNVFGVARCVKAVLPHMRAAAAEGKGHIVIVSSVVGKVPAPGMAWYPATKHALEAFGDGLRMEMKACFPGIKVAMVEPGYIPTKLLDHSIPTLDTACSSPYADIYREQLDNFRENFTRGFNAGSPVETISTAVSKAFGAEKPKDRYRPNADAKAGVFAKKYLEGKILDDYTIANFIGPPKD